MSFLKLAAGLFFAWVGFTLGLGVPVAEKMKFDRHDLIFVKRTTDFTSQSPYALVIFRATLPEALKNENPDLEEKIFLGFTQYDPVNKKLFHYESDLKGGFGITVRKNKKNDLRKQFRIFRIYPGHYILSHTTTIWPGTIHQIFITGETLTFEAKPGKIHYLGDFEIFPEVPGSGLFGPIDYNILGYDLETVHEVLKLYKDIDAEVVVPEFSKDYFNCNNKTPTLSQRRSGKMEQFCETENRKY